MRFQVPQFIDVEDKIFGPLTIKQFIYLAGAAGITFVLWTLMPLFLAIVFAAPIIALALALAFYKVNQRPFITVLESAFRYGTRDKLYIWKKEDTAPKRRAVTREAQQALPIVPKLSESKLKDLSWSLDIKESIYSDKEQRT